MSLILRFLVGNFLAYSMNDLIIQMHFLNYIFMWICMSVLLSSLYLLFTRAKILNPLRLGKQIFRSFSLYNFRYFKMHDQLYQGYNIIVLFYSWMGENSLFSLKHTIILFGLVYNIIRFPFWIAEVIFALSTNDFSRVDELKF